MANLTITVDDEVLRRARIRALEQGTSVNALLRQYLDAYAARGAGRALREVAGMARKASSGSGAGGRKWRREDVYGR